MVKAWDLNSDALARRLAYAGFVLIAYELCKSMIVGPIKAFYEDTTFGQGMPFTNYEDDVKARHSNEFEACLLYLRDFMKALDAEDVSSIQALRQHRNELAHNLTRVLPNLSPYNYRELWARVDRALFKLSNHREDMEIGADPEYQGIDWSIAKGGEYLLFEKAVEAIKLLNNEPTNSPKVIAEIDEDW